MSTRQVHGNNSLIQVQSLDSTTIDLPESALIRLFSQAGENFSSERKMREWLVSKNVDLAQADSAKGLNKLFDKIIKGEARLNYDPQDGNVYRCASVARISAEVNIHGQTYPLIELCQIFLESKIEHDVLEISEMEGLNRVLSSLKIRSAHVRDSGELWETFIGSEDPLAGARRGVKEELGLSDAESKIVKLELTTSALEYESPIDWPGIHSVLHTHKASAIIPEQISKPVYAELESGDQISIFVAGPNTPFLRAIMKQILPNINYTR